MNAAAKGKRGGAPVVIVTVLLAVAATFAVGDARYLKLCSPGFTKIV